MLLTNGADVNCLSLSRRNIPGSALHEATVNKHRDMAGMLLSYGAQPFQANSQGVTPMDLAISTGQCMLVRMFEVQALGRAEVSRSEIFK